MWPIDAGAFLHLQWLYVQSWGPVIFLTNTLTLEGAVLPALISLLIGLHWGPRLTRRQWAVLTFLLLGIWTVGMWSEYWGQAGLHIFPLGMILWPLLVFATKGRFPWPLAYPLSFVGMIVPDLLGAGDYLHWSGLWYGGIGGAGFGDGDFRTPLITVTAAGVVWLVRTLLTQRTRYPRMRRGLYGDR